MTYCNLSRPAGFGVAGRIAPAVVIESKKIDTLVVSTAIHVMSRLDTIIIYTLFNIRLE